ncbi:hypothetical protein E4U11_006921 [Claviceps purpurea]|nr:hypothetical protein E4U11_006921 [Claviceps purpurea]
MSKMTRMSTRAPGLTTENTPGQDPSRSCSLPVHPAGPAPSIDVQRGERQGFQDRLAQAEAAIAMARAARADAETAIADAEARIALVRAEAEARASVAIHNPRPTLNRDTLGHQRGVSVADAETCGPEDRYFPEIVCAIARDLGVAVAAVDQVYSGKFEPMNLLRLHPERGWCVYENESTAVTNHSSGVLQFKKRTFTASDYGDTPSFFITAFTNFILVYYRLFGVRRLDVLSAQLRFLSYISQLSETYNWGSCLAYAMSRLTAIRDNDVHDVAGWHI